MSDSVYHSLADLAATERLITIGAFDGVHRGHQKLLQAAVQRGNETSLTTTVVTFEPLPTSVIRPDRYHGRICTANEKASRILTTGAAELVVIPFDREFSLTSAEEFFSDLVTKAGMRELWVGEAFAMGKDRFGNIKRLKELGTEYDIEFTAMPRVTIDGEIISSSGIRANIESGNAAEAMRCLGRPFRVTGEVIHGAHLGRKIGYPTANLVPPVDLVTLADGIYVSLTSLPSQDHRYPSMTYVGTRPTVDDGARLVETHLLDFDGDLYGQVITVDILVRLRPDATFDGLEPMIAQLSKDERAARRWLANIDPGLKSLIDP